MRALNACGVLLSKADVKELTAAYTGSNADTNPDTHYLGVDCRIHHARSVGAGQLCQSGAAALL